MDKIIEQIIREIEKGYVFDSHYVIDTVIREHSDDYLEFASHNLATSKITEYAHSKLAKIIASFHGNLVNKLPYKSISYNIRGKASSCALWERI